MGGKGSGTVNAVLMRLDGTKIKADGTEEKSEFFEALQLPEGDYLNLEISPEQAVKLRNLAIRMKFGTSAAMPMLCLGGSKCPNKECPLDSKSGFPVGSRCPIEARYIQVKTQSYVEDLEIDVNSPTQMSMINRLVEIDLMDFRANASLAADEEAQTLLKTATYTNGDFTTETLSIHPLIEIKDRHHKQRMQILEALVATPKEKYKKASSLKKKDTEDSAHHLARLRDAYEIIQKEGAAAMKKIASEAESVNVSEEVDWSESGSGLD